MRWVAPRRPPEQAGSWVRVDAQAAVTALVDALGASASEAAGFRVVSRRLAGRSTIYVVGSTVPVGGHSQWLIKQPHTQWRQGDLPPPIPAEFEFEALVRLQVHLANRPTPDPSSRASRRVRVPAPVALLPAIGALAMEYVPGRTGRELLTYASVARPAPLLEALAASGAFLRELHALQSLPDAECDLRALATRILASECEALHPVGLTLPPEVRVALEGVPHTATPGRQVLLHGDFGPANVLLADDGTTVGLDPALDEVGSPEVDLARYVAVLSTSVRFAPELLARPAAWVRRRLVREVLDNYYLAPPPVQVFELHLMLQLTRRWVRVRELARQNEHPALLPLRLRVIDAQVRRLLHDSAHRLTTC